MPGKKVKFVRLHFSCLCCLCICHFKKSVGFRNEMICLRLWKLPERVAGQMLRWLHHPQERWSPWCCLQHGIIAFSPVSSTSRTCAGLLFLTSVSYTDPDQFVYKTQPPREQPDTSPDVMMNSYLGLWSRRWQINCLGHAHLKHFFFIHTEHKSFYFLFHFKWSRTGSMLRWRLCRQMVFRAGFD